MHRTHHVWRLGLVYLFMSLGQPGVCPQRGGYCYGTGRDAEAESPPEGKFTQPAPAWVPILSTASNGGPTVLLLSVGREVLIHFSA